MLHIISVVRFDYKPNHTKSMIFVDGEFFSFGLEPEYKGGIPIFGDRDLIPEGVYKVVLSFSPKFRRVLPEVLNVPFNSGGHGAGDSPLMCCRIQAKFCGKF